MAFLSGAQANVLLFRKSCSLVRTSLLLNLKISSFFTPFSVHTEEMAGRVSIRQAEGHKKAVVLVVVGH
jgi:hypothetical protein